MTVGESVHINTPSVAGAAIADALVTDGASGTAVRDGAVQRRHGVAAAPAGAPADAPPAGAVDQPADHGARSPASGRTDSDRLNRLRAGVLGANDGIVSTAALILGVAGATGARAPILLAGSVGLLAGAMSMGVGEYVSVSAQRDAERALGHRPDGFVNPVQASVASFVSFVLGAAIPLVGVLISTTAWITVIAVTVALTITGAVSSRLGRAPARRAVIRNVVGGLVAMAVTFGLGSLVGRLF
jgi:VIT1/CCC1 family predicted Fe2+/Mn2+ transporter